MKIWIKWVIAIILVIILVIFFGVSSCSNNEEKDKLEQEKKELKMELAVQKRNAADLAAKLDTCENDIPRPQTIEERLAAVEAENERLKSQPVAVVAAPAPVRRSYVKPKRTVVKNDVEEKQFEQVTFTAPIAKVSSQMTQASGNANSNIQYKPEFKGDIGSTITPKLNPIYYIKGNASIKSAPHWCGDSNKKMNYDSEIGYWFYIDYGRILTDQDLTDSNFHLLWNIFIGMVNWSGGSYKAWLPHENIKPLLNSVRGFEHGYITNDDLNQMSNKDSRVWSPSNPAGIYQPIKEAVHERTDQNFYHGWNFRTKVNFTRIIN